MLGNKGSRCGFEVLLLRTCCNAASKCLHEYMSGALRGLQVFLCCTETRDQQSCDAIGH